MAFCSFAFFVSPADSSATEIGPDSEWHYGGYVDVSYAVDFNFPDNHRWRSKGTTPRVNEFAPNMLLAYVQKDLTVSSRWGMEFGVQGGYDTNALALESIPGLDRPVDGADTLRHFSRANVSYLAPIGNGLVLTAGLFNSYIGYQSIFAKQNLNYTRSYMADNAPYYMFGIAAAQQTTAPTSNAAAGPPGCCAPSVTRSNADVTMIVPMATPETGLLELPTRPAI